MPLTRKTPLRRVPLPPSQTPLKRTELPRGRKGIKSRSDKRRAVLEDERALYAKVVVAAGMCERCKERPAMEAHHLLRRSSGRERLERSNLVGLCRGCHRFIHNNPRLSYEEGWLRSKF